MRGCLDRGCVDIDAVRVVAELARVVGAFAQLGFHQKPVEKIIEVSEAIFSKMAEFASRDAQKMIESVRRKTRFHFSYVALALNANHPEPYEHWRRVRAALAARDADAVSQAARDILYFMQGEVARIMLTHGRRAANNRA